MEYKGAAIEDGVAAFEGGAPAEHGVPEADGAPAEHGVLDGPDDDGAKHVEDSALSRIPDDGAV